jgi:hypothetical protein
MKFFVILYRLFGGQDIMTMRPKSINLYLMDGDPSKRIKCSLANWTGVAYKIPRTELDKCKGRDDLCQSGVYFLFGTDEQTGKDIVYIGQAGVRKNGEGILYRLQEHKRNSNKDYWTEAVVFTTSNNSFGPTEISHLESNFCKMAMEANRYIVKNGNEPTSGNVTEEKESELDEFIDYAKIIMGTLGHKLFEKLTETKLSTDEPVDALVKLLHLKSTSQKSGQTIEAKCKQTTEGFVVLKGSRIDLNDKPTIPYAVKEIRQKVTIDKDGTLQEDVLLKSPSYAAAFVIGGVTNGLLAWKTKDGKTLKELESDGT